MSKQLLFAEFSMPIDEEVAREIAHHIEDDRQEHGAFSSKISSIDSRLLNVERQISGKIGWAWFVGTMITLLTIQITVFVILLGQINQIQHDVQDTKVGLSQLNGRLEPYDFSREN